MTRQRLNSGGTRGATTAGAKKALQTLSGLARPRRSAAPVGRRSSRVSPEHALDAAYELVLGRPSDPSGRQAYLRRLDQGENSVFDICNDLFHSQEFAARLGTRLLSDPDVLLAKPVSNVNEAPELLISFGTLLRGLKPSPGDRVLDFGAGICWTSRLLAQLGCQVKAMDVSATALQIGRESFERSPLFGTAEAPEFLVFDGRRFDLDDESIDLIVCFDAFHHIPNPQAILAEMARVPAAWLPSDRVVGEVSLGA